MYIYLRVNQMIQVQYAILSFTVCMRCIIINNNKPATYKIRFIHRYIIPAAAEQSNETLPTISSACSPQLRAGSSQQFGLKRMYKQEFARLITSHSEGDNSKIYCFFVLGRVSCAFTAFSRLICRWQMFISPTYPPIFFTAFGNGFFLNCFHMNHEIENTIWKNESLPEKGTFQFTIAIIEVDYILPFGCGQPQVGSTLRGGQK